MKNHADALINIHAEFYAPPQRCYETRELRLRRAPECGALYRVEVTVWDWDKQETIEFLIFYHDGPFERGELDESRNEILLHAREAIDEWMFQNRARRPLCNWKHPIVMDFS